MLKNATPSDFGKAAYSVDEFCAAFSLGRTKTYEEIGAGRLKAVKIGRRTIIPAVNAFEWLAAQVDAN